MHMRFKHAMLAGASFAFLAISGATLTSSSAQAGPLAVAPKQTIVPAALTENVQYRRARGTRVGVRRAGIRHRGVRRAGVRYVRRGYGYGYGHNAFLPAAALGLFAGVLGAATYGATAPFCDPYYYSANYCPPYGGGYYPAYYGGGYYPGYYGGGYYPAYYGGAYPVYRSRRVVYRHVQAPRRVYVHRQVRGPRVVRYRAVAPRRHFVGSRTYVRSGYRTVGARSRR